MGCNSGCWDAGFSAASKTIWPSASESYEAVVLFLGASIVQAMFQVCGSESKPFMHMR